MADDNQPAPLISSFHRTYSSVITHSEKLRDRFTQNVDLITKKACENVFLGIDLDKSGTLDISEVYIGVLLVYCSLGGFVAGLTPPTLQSIENLLKEVDVDDNGSLDLEEFTALCSILLGGLTTRVIGQLSLQLFIVPTLSIVLLTRIGYYWALYLHDSANPTTTGVQTMPTIKDMHISPILITVFSIVLNMLIIPRLMNLIDTSMLQNAKCIKTK